MLHFIEKMMSLLLVISLQVLTSQKRAEMIEKVSEKAKHINGTGYYLEFLRRKSVL